MEIDYWARAQHLFQQAGLSDWLKALPESVRIELPRVAAGSDFVIRQMVADRLNFAVLIAHNVLFSESTPQYTAKDFLDFLSQHPDSVTEQGFDRALRLYRNRAYVALIWRDLMGRDDLWQTMASLSQLADTLIMATTIFHRAQLVTRFGEPRSGAGKRQHLVTLAMGKLGADELNLSSDVDLIFCFPSAGHTQPDDGGQRSIENQEFFVKLGQSIIKSLSHPMTEGFVFRVDMRLRPFGQSGALALNFNALETYYQDHGRPWERYAFIKARPITQDIDAGRQIIARLQPFVFRRYIDFGAIEELRDMKALINQEVTRRGQQHNLKLGPGGIREIEFIVQAFQLIRGGQQREFQQRALRQILKLLAVSGLMPESAVLALEEAYVFLRISEHHLQAVDDQQTHTLPKEPSEGLRLAKTMGFRCWSDYLSVLNQHRACVRKHFDEMVCRPVQSHSGDAPSPWVEHFSVWWHKPTERLLPKDHAFALSSSVEQECLESLKAFRVEIDKKRLSAKGQARIDRLVPRLLVCCMSQPQPDVVLSRVLPILVNVLRRSAYIVLLIERPDALARLLQLCLASPWLAEYLRKFPGLLDELLCLPDSLQTPSAADLANELRYQLTRVSESDLETQMEILRQFKNTHVFYAAVSEIQHDMPVDAISRYLTAVAQTVVQAAFDIASLQVSSRYSNVHSELVALAKAHYVIIAMGKMGSCEMSYGSDLDLIFAHDCDTTANVTPGCAIDNSTFFTRLTQRLIHILSTSTYTGRLYEIDTRLRPFGGSGLLVSTMSSLARYLREEAWVWEHQALVRARVIVGEGALSQTFVRLRADILKSNRDEVQLKTQVRDMRTKMAAHLRPKPQDGIFHLKHDAGGMVDIEFIAQFMVLRWASVHPDLTNFTEVAHILRAVGRHELLSKEQVSALIEAYGDYRSRYHRLVLQNQRDAVADELVLTQKNSVINVWNNCF